jgi:ferric-dicitrate binding protein FerR (iron transport regulator)
VALEELAERVEAAYAATTRGDLAVVTDDLPARAEAPVPAQRDDPAPAAPTRRRMLGIMAATTCAVPCAWSPSAASST